MLIDLPYLWIAIINIIGIPITHLTIAWISTILPEKLFQKPNPSAPSQTEIKILENLFQVRKLKHLLPDAAPWFKGFPKAKLKNKSPQYLKKFITETRRGEFSHHLQILAILTFTLWTPTPYTITIPIYALLSNLPCILNLRHTRARLTRTLLKTSNS